MKSSIAKVTENSGSRKRKQQLFSQAGAIAVRSARNSNLPLTYADGNEIVRESPDGSKKVIAVISANSKKIPKKFEIK